MSLKLYISFILFSQAVISGAQNFSIDIVHDSLNTSLRGLSVVNNSTIWTSGSNGYVGRSIDGGDSWEFKRLPGYDSAEFRDIEAFDENIAIVMSSVQPACILKTIDGGKTWNETFRDDNPVIFLDGIDFSKNRGVCIGDPVSDKFLILYSDNYGDTWVIPDTSKLPNAVEGMAAFAASGTGIQFVNNKKFKFGTGGINSGKLYSNKFNSNSWKVDDVPINDLSNSSGIFSILFINACRGFVVGGDYSQPDLISQNFSFTKNGGTKWITSTYPPSGYRSCITEMENNYVISCGTNGVDIAKIKKSMEWTNISKTGYNVVQKANSGNIVLLAGNNGRIGIIRINNKD